MQPLQYDLQCPAVKDNSNYSITHATAAPSNLACSMTWLTRMHLRTWHHQMTTITQPFQYDLQPQVQETHRTTHAGPTTRCRTQRRRGNRLTSKRSKLHPPHTGGTLFITGCSHFTRKNARFRAPASSPKQSPCNIHAAITIRFAASRSKPPSLYTHGNAR